MADFTASIIEMYENNAFEDMDAMIAKFQLSTLANLIPEDPSPFSISVGFLGYIVDRLDVRETDIYGHNALMCVLHLISKQNTQSIYVEIVEKLITVSDLTTVTYNNRTALHMAARYGNIDAVRLLSGKIDADIMDVDGRTAIYQAMMTGNTDLVALLIPVSDLSITYNYQSHDRFNLLASAVINIPDNMIGMVKLLMTVIDINALSSEGATALHLACASPNRYQRSFADIDFMISASDTSIRSSSKQTYLDLLWTWRGQYCRTLYNKMEKRLVVLEEQVNDQAVTIQDYQDYGPPLVEGGGDGYQLAKKSWTG